MKKKLLTLTMAIGLAMAMSMTAFAGWEQDGTGWKYNDNGTYASNGWQWIDENKDGIAESYYFDGNGYMLANTTTPDGYTVNADGAWVENGVVQTKRLDPHLSEVINPQQGLNGGEVTDGKSVAQITLNQELADLILAANSVDRLVNKTYAGDGNFGPIYMAQYRGGNIKATTDTSINCVSTIVGTVSQFFNNIPVNGIEVMAFYSNTGFTNADADRWIVGPTGEDVFGLGDAYMGSRFTSFWSERRFIKIVLTQGVDGNWYIYPNSQAFMNNGW